MSKLFKMEDAKTDRVAFVGTEKECMDFSKENPERSYNMIELKDNERSKYERSE